MSGPTDPPTPDLGAIRARLLQAMARHGHTAEVVKSDVLAVLNHVDAQAARLAAAARLVGLWTQGAEGSLETLEALETLLDGTDAEPLQAGVVEAGEVRDGA